MQIGHSFAVSDVVVHNLKQTDKKRTQLKGGTAKERSNHRKHLTILVVS